MFKKPGDLLTQKEMLDKIRREYITASCRFPPFTSAHEGYAIILEELDELWDEIKHKPKDWKQIKKEVIQIGAMALRFLIDLEEIK